jgi:YbbR domain-containing protein
MSGRWPGGKLLLKLLSLLFAAVLWLFVALEKTDDLDLTVPVTFVRLPAGLLLKEPLPSRLQVRISGATILLMRQQFRPPSLTLDLAGVKAGKVSFTGLEQAIDLVPGLRVSRIQPAAIDLVIGKKQAATSQRSSL